jgi:hypothetical protein
MIVGIVLPIFPHHLLHASSASGGWAMTFEEILDQAVTMP